MVAVPGVASVLRVSFVPGTTGRRPTESTGTGSAVILNCRVMVLVAADFAGRRLSLSPAYRTMHAMLFTHAPDYIPPGGTNQAPGIYLVRRRMVGIDHR
ncbi:hypothetical protein ASF62_11945 [Leifsonia sp. Leaf325]|nr:hypothetical protein ASF62_11945 [Leifsonia sp. Leaf325]